MVASIEIQMAACLWSSKVFKIIPMIFTKGQNI